MRQVFLHKGLAVVKEICEPVIDDNAVLVAVHYSFISSGTESATIKQAEQNYLFSSISHKLKKTLDSISLHGIDGTVALIKSKLQGELQVLGYSCSGRVIAAGKKVKTVRVGDYVACAGAGFAHHADLVSVPEYLVVKVKHELLKEASITTIGTIALQGMRQANIQLGEVVCVMGLGLLGQLTVQLAKRVGATVIGLDLLQERLDVAKSLGCDYTFLATQENTQSEVDYITDHYGVDVTIITAAAQQDTIIQQAMQLTRKKGKVILVGDVQLQFDRAPFYVKEIDFKVSCSYGPGRYDPTYEQQGIDYPFAYVRWTENRNMRAFIRLLEQQQINVKALISYEATLDTVVEAYDHIKNKEGLGVVISYNNVLLDSYPEEPLSTRVPSLFRPAYKDSTVRVGMIGAGGFAKVKLMPIISKLANTKISIIADADITTAINSSQVYKAAACTNYIDFFKEDLVDVVVVASPHKFHCAQTVAALSYGKAVFVEKPMVTTWEQLYELRAFLKEHKNAPIVVDYNRSFAPFIKKIKHALQNRKQPLMLHYRMNAGLVSKDHWMQTEVGAGRIIGEACHIIDLFYYLTDSRPVSVSVESLYSSDENIFPTDNFSVQLGFEDGSVCSLLYTSVGNKRLSKERMELFFDGKSIVMDDYMVLQGYGLYSGFDEYKKQQEKGHAQLIETFFKALAQPTFEPPIAYERLDLVAELSLIIDALACKGGGAQDVT